MRLLVLAWVAGCGGGAAETGDTAVDTADTADSDTDGGADRPFFPEGAPWTRRIEGDAVDPGSDAMIAALQAAGWGVGNFQIDLSIEVLTADASTPRRSFSKSADFYEPDCDFLPMPVPVDGNLEGEEGYRCLSDGDCHLIVVEEDSRQLFEMWRADIDGELFRGGCLAVWDLNLVYGPEGRGAQCTSADAAGYPIAPLLFTADEVAAGRIDHAMRFALPNDLIADTYYHAPATHGTTAGADGPIPYGARLRLKADFDMDRLADPEARVIARALQEYGMFLADGGRVPLMGRSDRRTGAKWDALLEDGTHALFGMEPRDFEVVKLEGEPVPLTFDCRR